jgi:hypothetical protein
MDTEKNQDPLTPYQKPLTLYQAGYVFGLGAALARLHSISIDDLVLMGEAMWTGGTEYESFGTFDRLRFKEGFVAGFYGRASEEDLQRDRQMCDGDWGRGRCRVPLWLSRRSRTY